MKKGVTQPPDVQVVLHSHIFSASLAFIVRVLVLVALNFVVNNFGKGLKEIGKYGSMRPVFCNEGLVQTSIFTCTEPNVSIKYM